MSDIQDETLEFFEREDVTFAHDKVTWKNFRVYSDATLHEASITLCELMMKGRRITKSEAVKHSREWGK